MVGCLALLVAVTACSEEPPAPAPARTYPTSFTVTDPAGDAESTAEAVVAPPDVDLTAIAAEVGRTGIRARFTYAEGWSPDSASRWGIRFEIKGSDGSRISGAWTQDPASTALTPRVDLAPRPDGCRASVQVSNPTRRLTLALGPACLPRPTPGRKRRWIRFDSIGTVSSWHSASQILYAWDQLYSRLVAPEPARLYLPD
jgi:hypothetical protein